MFFLIILLCDVIFAGMGSGDGKLCEITRQKTLVGDRNGRILWRFNAKKEAS